MRIKVILLGLLLASILVAGFYTYRSYDTSNATIVGAIEEMRGEDKVEYIVHEDRTPQGAFLYYLRTDGDGSPLVHSDYVEKTLFDRWKWVFGGMHGGFDLSLVDPYEEERGVPFSSQFLPILEVEKHKLPYPVVFGGLSDPGISRVVVSDSETGSQHEATIIPYNDHFRLYFAYLNGSDLWKVKIDAFDEHGTMIDTETIEHPLQSSGSGATYEDKAFTKVESERKE